MKNKNIFIYFTVLCSAMLTVGCSNPYSKAEEFKKSLNKSAYIINEFYNEETPQLITAEKVNENDIEKYRISIHDLKNNSTETLNCSFKPIEVLKNSEGYLVISEYTHADTPNRKSYCVETISNGTSTTVWLDEEDEMAIPTAYVVDKSAKHIILSGVSTFDNIAKEYYVKFDFDGNRVAEDTKKFKLEPAKRAMYLWVCSLCGATANNTSATTPAIPYTRCKLDRYGVGKAHRMSNHGRVD